MLLPLLMMMSTALGQTFLYVTAGPTNGAEDCSLRTRCSLSKAIALLDGASQETVVLAPGLYVGGYGVSRSNATRGEERENWRCG